MTEKLRNSGMWQISTLLALFVAVSALAVSWGINKEKIGTLEKQVAEQSALARSINEAITEIRLDIITIKTELIYVKQTVKEIKRYQSEVLREQR